MKQVFFLLLLTISSGFFSCSFHSSIYVVTGQNEQMIDAGNDLADYLVKTYPSIPVKVVSEKVPNSRNILLEITEDTSLPNNEAYRVFGDAQELRIQGKTPRALRNGVYGLLKELGWHFYLSFEVPPGDPKPLDFSAIKIENHPLKERRIIFNWHNFLSGCTGWDYAQWQQWIDRSAAIGFNTIMVHAYGNNPMQSFSFNGVEKDLGYLTTTKKGRDWGAQHVNDVRLLYGGQLFDNAVFGSEAAKAPDSERSRAATALMQQVFKHAAQKEMDVCFAMDIDTWMANPQNIIRTLPKEALIEIGGYETVNPDHPEGRKYYLTQLEKLFSDYPEITILATWMRRPSTTPSVGSIWLLHNSNTLPPPWRKEYFQIIKNNPGLKDELPYPGLFAISKIEKVFREILDEIKPGVELALGSWEFDFMEKAAPFIPKYCSFIPLDYGYVFNRQEIMEQLKKASENRKVYPVMWAHHDDHRYIGRPYVPFSDFNQLLNEINSSGYGIIHWMTHPLDLLFSSYESQIWKNSVNETLEKTIESYTKALVQKEDESLHAYFKKWFTEAPMFGRETSDYFQRIQDEYQLDGYASAIEVVEKAKQRLELLDNVNKANLNAQGKKEYHYQWGMEQFIISFFTNHHIAHEAISQLGKNNYSEAVSLAQQLDPEKTIGFYTKTIEEYGATRGEEGVLISLNLRWLPDYIDLKQRVALSPVFINFQPTLHDPLAQGAGKNTFFVDEEKNIWLSLGEKELGIPAEALAERPLSNVHDSWLAIAEPREVSVKTMRNSNLPASACEIQLIQGPQSAGYTIEVEENGRTISSFHVAENLEVAKGNFKSEGGNISVKVIPDSGTVRLAGVKVSFLKAN